jgi:hypothetical protein
MANARKMVCCCQNHAISDGNQQPSMHTTYTSTVMLKTLNGGGLIQKSEAEAHFKSLREIWNYK